MSDRYAKSFVDHVCEYEDQLKIVFVLSVTVLVLLVPFFLGVERGTSTFVVVVLDAAGLLVLAVISGFFVVRCS